MARTLIDSRGTVCPGPVLDLFRAYRKAASGDEIELLVTDLAAPSDIKAWAAEHDSKVLEVAAAKEGHTRIVVKVKK